MQIKMLALLLLLLLFHNFEINENVYFEYSGEDKFLRIMFTNSSIIQINNSYLKFKYEILNLNSTRFLVKTYFEAKNSSKSIFIEGKAIIDDKGKVWLINGTYIGKTFLFLKYNFDQVNKIYNIGINESFEITVFSKITENLGKFGYQDLRFVQIKSKSLNFLKKYNLLTFGEIAYYDDDSGILVYAEGYFLEPLFLTLNIVTFSSKLKLYDTNYNLGPQNNLAFFIDLIYRNFILILIIFIVILFLIIYKKRFK